MYQGFKDRVTFYIVYIREAHPVDGWRMDQNDKDGIKITDPKTTAERMGVAGECVEDLGLTLPCLVDNIEDQANKVYCGWPDRLYVLEKGGKVAYQGAMGPAGFKPDEAAEAIEELVGPPKKDK